VEISIATDKSELSREEEVRVFIKNRIKKSKKCLTKNNGYAIISLVE